MARTNAATDLANARTDLVLALADLSTGDSIHNMIEDLIERLDYIVTRNTA